MDQATDNRPDEAPEPRILIRMVTLRGAQSFAVAKPGRVPVWRIYVDGRMYASTDIDELRLIVDEVTRDI